MKRYPEYKDSHIAWLGEIPSHWEIMRMKYCTDIIMGQSPDSNDIKENGNILFMQGNREFGEHYPNPTVYCDTCSKHSRVGDILMSVRAPVGAINESDKVYGIGRGLCSIKAINISTSFLKYYLMKSTKDFRYYSYGSTFEAITIKNLKTFPIPLPPLSEQDKIARYLDYKVSRINKLISLRKQQLIDLAELKKVIINNSVTKGLNPNAELKQSGVKWLGEIPAHWEISRLKYVAQLNPKCNIYDIKPDDYVTFAPMECIRADKRIERTAQFSANNLSYNGFNDGDIALAKVTPCFQNNNVCIMSNLVNGYAFGSSELFNIRPQNIHPRFLLYYLMTKFFKDGGVASMTGAVGLKRVSSTYVNNAYIPLPPLSEQNQISSYLDDICGKIDRLITLYEREISLFDELKARLISDCVTGQLDLRDIII